MQWHSLCVPLIVPEQLNFDTGGFSTSAMMFV
jgi:hypothetical protein